VTLDEPTFDVDADAGAVGDTAVVDALGIAPLFVSMGGNVNTLNCGPNGKLTGKIELIGVSNAGDDYGRNMGSCGGRERV